LPDIKTKEMIKDIKSIDKSAYLKNMKNAFVRTKEKAEETQRSDSDTPHTYATESVSAKAKELSNTAAKKTELFSRQSLKKAPDTLQKAKIDASNIKQRIHNTAKSIKTKRAVRTASHSRTAGKTAANTVKKSKQTAQVSVKTAQATMKASQKAAQTARATAKATAHTAKAVMATVKATIAAVKGLITLIAAGGWVAIVVILIICMVGLLVSSPFGIFFSNEETNNPSDMSITSAIEQINHDFNTKIEQIKFENPHDEVDGITTPQNWKEVLAIYAVKYSTDPNNPNEVATIDSQKFEDIKTVFWDMNSITFTIETIESEAVSEDPSTSAQPSSKIILHITVENKSCSEIAAQYAFNPEQHEQLNELMSNEFNNVWEKFLDNS